MPQHKRVVILGHGCRLGGADIEPLLRLPIPVLTSWPAADLVDSLHPNYFGRPGVYGQRCANKVLDGADHVLAIGCRLSIWTVGYAFPKEGQKVVMVDVDGDEARRIGAEWINDTAEHFLSASAIEVASEEWLAQCRFWREQYPWIEAAHTHGKYINPHRFIASMQRFLNADETIVADCATGSLAAHQVLRLKPPMRLMTSGGLGEMGCGLPAAVGASFARNKGRVVCLTSDGGIMLTLMELATIAHHKLPVKIVVFANDGYGMIKDTQRNLGMRRSGVDRASGVSCPDLARVADSFDITAGRLALPEKIDSALDWLSSQNGPALLQVDIDPEYVWAPKLRPGRNEDGTIKNADFAEMEPAL